MNDSVFVGTLDAHLVALVEAHQGLGAGLRRQPVMVEQAHLLPHVGPRHRIGGIRNCVAYGPGILDLAHQPDEWCGVDDLVNATKVLALSILDLTGTI